MALKKKPVTGMKDILPQEMQIRDYVLNQIKETYRGFGFSSIETPCVEHIENLLSKQGGDNEKLIFKVLKRGEKLNLEAAETENDLADSGLRYDLTLPLSRYYSNNAANLPSPFKALQIGSVWRADRPQKGRYRQFVQCDIDIFGDATSQAEIELVLATTTALKKICPNNQFEVRINDRKILRAMAVYSGFPEEDIEKVFITVDKMDKIGVDGVRAELVENGYSEETADKYLELMGQVTNDADGARRMAGQLQNPGVHTPGGQAVPFPQLHCGCKREERLGLEAVTGERQQEPARRSLGGQGLRLLIGEQAQIRRMEGGGNAQPLHKQGGVLNVVQVAVGQHDQPHPGPQAGIQQALHVAGIAGVHQDGALLPLHQIAVHIAAGDAVDAPHRTTPLRVFPSSPSSCTCTRQL